MGLDMYLYVEKYVPYMSWDEEEERNQEFDELVEFMELGELIDKEEGYISAYAKVQVAYWRKVNTIHNYFVTKCADGKDECQDIEVYRETLEHLRDICGQITQSKDVEQAKELLPPQSGFFFGSIEIDEWYFQGIEYTYNVLTKVLEKTPKEYDFIYRASW